MKKSTKRVLIPALLILCVASYAARDKDENTSDTPDSESTLSVSDLASSDEEQNTDNSSLTFAETENANGESQNYDVETDNSGSTDVEQTAESAGNSVNIGSAVELDPSSVPTWSDEPYVILNDGVPYFSTPDDISFTFESYSELDSLGRAGSAFACVGTETMPTDERGSIGNIKPSGWHTVRYGDIIDGSYLYNRCHLIGYQLAGENANEKNLITGTRYLNVEGMLPLENKVVDYVQYTGNHVLYRSTPIYEGDNLLASGVLVEAKSYEDDGAGIQFCVYCYNVQPGITIDYSDGESTLSSVSAESEVASASETSTVTTQEPGAETQQAETAAQEPVGTTYILNTNSKKFHYPSCSSVGDMKSSNKQEYTGSRDDVIAMGYSPCGRCKP